MASLVFLHRKRIPFKRLYSCWAHGVFPLLQTRGGNHLNKQLSSQGDSGEVVVRDGFANTFPGKVQYFGKKIKKLHAFRGCNYCNEGSFFSFAPRESAHANRPEFVPFLGISRAVTFPVSSPCTSHGSLMGCDAVPSLTPQLGWDAAKAPAMRWQF